MTRLYEAKERTMGRGNLITSRRHRTDRALRAAVEPLEIRRLLAVAAGGATEVADFAFPLDETDQAEVDGGAASWSYDSSTAALTIRGNGSSERFRFQMNASGTVEVVR